MSQKPTAVHMTPAHVLLSPGSETGWYAILESDSPIEDYTLRATRRGPYENKMLALAAFEPWACAVTDDPLQESPCELGGFTVYSFNRRHRSFKHPAELGIEGPNEFGEPVITDEDLKKKLDEGLAFILGYSEHGLCCWTVGGKDDWDSRAVAGLMVLDPDYVPSTDYEGRDEYARLCAEEYTAWCNGEVYEVYFTKDGEVVEDAGGICYGQESVERARAAVAEHYELDEKPKVFWPWEAA
jgi:hypothetical protein